MKENVIDSSAKQLAKSIGNRVNSIAGILSAMPADETTLAKIQADPMITLLTHPVIQHKISLLRQKHLSKRDVRMLVREIAIMGFCEQAKDLPMELVDVETPISWTTTLELSGKKPVLLPIWRAGEAMSTAISDTIMPSAKVGSVGMHRNPDDITHPVCYFDKMPDKMSEREVFVLDPMLATGWSAAAVISNLKQKYGCQKIHFMCIFSVWDGIEVLRREHPDVDLCIGVVDFGLNDKFYIVPGAGDMGDRIYGTK